MQYLDSFLFDRDLIPVARHSQQVLYLIYLDLTLTFPMFRIQSFHLALSIALLTFPLTNSYTTQALPRIDLEYRIQAPRSTAYAIISPFMPLST